MAIEITARNDLDDRAPEQCCTTLILTASDDAEYQLLAAIVEWGMCGGKIAITSNGTKTVYKITHRGRIT